jgi:hypothetical protein
MDQHHVAVLTRVLSRVPSRRDVLRGLAGAGLVLSALRRQDAAEAKKKRKKKRKKKPALNAFGCLDVGRSCRGNSASCCSGLCEGKNPKKGKKDTSTCVAHNAGICGPDSNACLEEVLCNPSNPNCRCAPTTGNAGFCADLTPFFIDPSGSCRDCSKDTDCQAEFGPGAACIVFGSPCILACPATDGKACVPPCA